MKKFKLPFPKLKHPTLCKIVLYSPVFLAFALFLLIAVSDDKIEAVLPVPAIIVIMFVPMILALILLIRGAIVFIGMDISLSAISAHLRDRKWFETNKNGKTRKEAEKYISRRMSHLGYTCSPSSSVPSPILIKYYSAFSWTLYYARIEKICLLYSVERLDTALYSKIITSVKTNTSPLHGDKSKMFL